LGGGAAGVQFARVIGDDYSKVWKLVNLGGASVAFVSEDYGMSDYFGSVSSSLPKGNGVEGVLDDIVSDNIGVQWVVAGFGSGGRFHDL
jgi:hypothetical protein